MGGAADQCRRAEPAARRSRQHAARQMNAVGLRGDGGIDVLMHHHRRAEAPPDGHQPPQQRFPAGCIEILLAQAEPAATADERRLGHTLDGPTRLMAIRDDEQRRVGENHPPISPSCGLDGSAWVRLGIRPARRASRPAITAARIAAAMRRGSCALATAVLSSTPSQPSSIACAASEAVPMPASRITGTGLVAQMRSMAYVLMMPSPLPIGEPNGMTAAAPASASLRQLTGSSLQ